MTPSGSIEVEVQRANALCDLGRFADATTLLHRLIASDNQNPRAWCVLALAQLRQDDGEAALSAATTAISVAPESEWAHRLASIALSDLDRHEEAMWHARECVRLAPHSWNGFVRLAQALKHVSGHAEEARRAAEHAVALAPDEADTHLTMGSIALAMGRRGDAEAAFRQALAIEPDNSAAHNELVRVRMGKWSIANPAGLAGAAGGFAAALRVDPRAQTSRDNLELVLRVFLARLAYFVFIDAWIAAHTSRTPIVPVALLLVPGAFAWRFVSELTPDLRRHLRALVLRRQAIAIPAALQALAVLCVVGAALAPDGVRGACVGVAVAAALLSRIAMWRELRRRR